MRYLGQYGGGDGAGLNVVQGVVDLTNSRKGFSAKEGTIINSGNDLEGDPVLRTFAGDDYHLGMGSAAQDRGPGVGVSIDIDGMGRPHGLAYDIGADEVLRMCLPLLTRSWAPPAQP